MKLTQEEYLASAGLNCPFCGGIGTVVADGNLDAGGIDAWQNASCEECNKCWTDFYRMIGFEDNS